MTELLKTLQLRVPYSVARQMIHGSGVKPGQGWNTTVDKFSKPNLLRQFDEERLKEYLLEHIHCGEKSVQIYEMDDNQISKLRTYFDRVALGKHEFTIRYPETLEDTELKQFDAIDPVLVSKESDQNYDYLVYAGVRKAAKQEKLDVLDQATFKDFEEVIGIKTIRAQVYDVIAISKTSNLVCSRVDLPLKIPPSHSIEGHSLLTHHLNMQIGSSVFFEPINLFPLISGFYNKKGEGFVVDLAFTTPTGTSRHEKMRLTHDCLRDEKYHKGGMAAIGGKFDPFRIAVRWPFDSEYDTAYYPELLLDSNKRELHTINPQLEQMSITGCLSKEHFENILTKTLHLYAMIGNDV